jgi:hypothetical protein
LGLSKWSSDFLVSYSSKNYQNKLISTDNVWKRVWNHLKRAGISPVFQKQEVPDFCYENFNRIDSSNPLEFLNDVEIFKSLSEDGKNLA